MSHGLKNVGDGDMKNGINTIIEYSEGEGMKKGGLIGVLATLGIIGAATGVRKLYLWNKDQKRKEKKIIDGFNKVKTDASKVENSIKENSEELD